MQRIAQNLRILLWREGINRKQWTNQLADWVGCDVNRAKQLLENGDLDLIEAEKIETKINVSAEEIFHVEFIADLEMFTENIRYLLSLQGHGSTQKLANFAGVDKTTVSRWKSGDFAPPTKRLHVIAEFFDLPNTVNLNKDPIFLSLDPIGQKAQKDWLHEHIDRLGAEKLNAYFLALKKLLE